MSTMSKQDRNQAVKLLRELNAYIATDTAKQDQAFWNALARLLSENSHLLAKMDDKYIEWQNHMADLSKDVVKWRQLQQTRDEAWEKKCAEITASLEKTRGIVYGLEDEAKRVKKEFGQNPLVERIFTVIFAAILTYLLVKYA